MTPRAKKYLVGWVTLFATLKRTDTGDSLLSSYLCLHPLPCALCKVDETKEKGAMKESNILSVAEYNQDKRKGGHKALSYCWSKFYRLGSRMHMDPRLMIFPPAIYSFFIHFSGQGIRSTPLDSFISKQFLKTALVLHCKDMHKAFHLDCYSFYPFVL